MCHRGSIGLTAATRVTTRTPAGDSERRQRRRLHPVLEPSGRQVAQDLYLEPRGRGRHGGLLLFRAEVRPAPRDSSSGSRDSAGRGEPGAPQWRREGRAAGRERDVQEGALVYGLPPPGRDRLCGRHGLAVVEHCPETGFGTAENGSPGRLRLMTY